MNPATQWIGRRLARYLTQPRHVHSTSVASDLPALAACLLPADVLLVEGHSKISSAVKYLTQSTWSHAALYVGDALGLRNEAGETLCIIEADVVHGVRAVALSEFAGLHCRICRPVGLQPQDITAVVDNARRRIGHQYDLKNIFDLARYLLPTPPVPQRWRRRLLALGSGDPTRAICSTLIAQAFQTVPYPVLPVIERRSTEDPLCPLCVEEILHVRHHSLFVPRDFDVSPYFQVIKPTLAVHFDHRALRWHDQEPAHPAIAR
jgi:Permuted papain-like amidase enzyme, YaeF/YiiX, C92 family